MPWQVASWLVQGWAGARAWGGRSEAGLVGPEHPRGAGGLGQGALPAAASLPFGGALICR